ncbi:DUF2304 domain-containing protein [Streptomyces formicae]|uniref:Uncharacterized protein n=1 Tax=Streptomyces formicae TaxID=1616117 RepID=A0A291QKC3_9ACTN|nr:DUF2304 domain-containing protein [Streptomyces formicae]ATL31924.1 hypothetical protein KY5_6906c [Streptomyces formicae]
MSSLHLPVILVLAAAAFFLFRKGGTKLSHVLVCAGFGFYLADTAAAANVRSALGSALSAVSGIVG